jgi:hypothetical protein
MTERRAGAAAVAMVVVVAVTAGAAGRAAAQSAAPPAVRATLAELAFMAGDWQGEAGPGAFSQEVWAAPAGDCMMGMWRLVVDGRVKLLEALSITQEDGGPVMRLRHYGRDGVGWEERDAPIALRVASAGGGVAVFEGPGRSGPLRITYRKTGDGTLSCAVEKSDGREEYSFRRASAWDGAPASAAGERRKEE